MTIAKRTTTARLASSWRMGSLYSIIRILAIAGALIGTSTAFGQGWTQLSNTALRATLTNSVCPANNFQPPGGGMPSYPFLSNCPAVIDSWGGAAADTKRNRMIFIGGGHAAYSGNEVYSLDLSTLSSTTATSCTTNPLNSCSTNVAAPAMTRLNDPALFSASPSAPDQVCPQTTSTLPNGTPISVHSYGAPVYLPKADAVTLWMGAPDTCGGANLNLFLFHADTQTWTNTNYTNDSGHGNSGGGIVGATGGVTWAIDPSTVNESLVGWVSNHDLIRYDTVTNKVYRLVNYATYTVQSAPSAVADPDRKLLFTMGNSNTTGTGKMYVTDLTDPNYTTTDWTSTVTGCNDLLDFSYPGLSWDPALHRIVGYVTKAAGTTTSANKIIIFDPATRTCATHPMSVGGPTAEDNFLTGFRGMWGRFGYFPSLGEYVVVNNTEADAWTFQLNATPTNGLGSSTLTCVDRDGDGYGTGPTALGPFTDLVINGSNNKVVTSASHSFVAADIGRVITITSGTGFTVQSNNEIVSVSAGAATMAFAMGTTSSTGGHWQIRGCTGPDADDQDVAVYTSAQFLSKWTDIPTGLKHFGYNPANIWYMSLAANSPAGNNGTGVVNDVTHPFLTCCGSGQANPAAGDALMVRGGYYSSVYTVPPAGTAGNPVIIMSYPGELAHFDTGFIDASSSNYIVIDGIRGTNSSGNGGFNFSGTPNFIARHVDASGAKWGLVGVNITGGAVIEDSVFHDNNPGGCGSTEHGIYLSNHINGVYSTNIFVRRNLMFNNCRNGLQMNGQFTNAVVEQNMSYSNGVGGVAWYNGVKSSTLQNNLLFNNASPGLIMADDASFTSCYGPTAIGLGTYPETGLLIQNNTMYSTGVDPSTPAGDPSQSQPIIGVTNSVNVVRSPTSVALSSSATYAFTLETWSSGTAYLTDEIVIYGGNYYTATDDSTNKQPDTNLGCGSGLYWNLIRATSTNFWTNGQRVKVRSRVNQAGVWMEGLVTGHTATTVTIAMDASTGGSTTLSDWVIDTPRANDLGSNTFSNNVLIPYSQGTSGGGYPAFRYDDTDYPSTTTFTNNLFYNLYPTAGTFTNVIQTKAANTTTYYTCAQATTASGTTFGSFSGCQNADPQFTASSPSYWNTPSSFNFRFVSGSPGLGVGGTVPYPSYDVVGAIVPTTSLSLGALQVASGCVLTPTSLGPYTAGQVISQTFAPSTCSSSTCSISAGSLGSSGLSLGGGSNCVLGGTSVVGNYSFTVAYDTASNPITLTINAAPSITTSSPLPSGTVSSAYSQTLAASGGTSPLVWSVSSGTVPTGTSLSSGGVLSGTPSTAVGSPFSFTVLVTDNNGSTNSKPFTLSIAALGVGGTKSGGNLKAGGQGRRK